MKLTEIQGDVRTVSLEVNRSASILSDIKANDEKSAADRERGIDELKKNVENVGKVAS